MDWGVLGPKNPKALHPSNTLHGPRNKFQPGPPRKMLVRVIREVWNGALDYFIPAVQAKELYKLGKLGWDEVNETYCEL